MQLEDLGWDGFFEAFFREAGTEGLVPARVSGHHRDYYRVITGDGELGARVAGRLRHKAASAGDLPAVGDWVAIEPRPAERQATIHSVLPRKTCFRRKVTLARAEEQVIAANADAVLVVTALDGDFSPRRLERYLTLAWESGARPVVVLNKVDLCDDVEAKLAETGEVAFGVDVCVTSAAAGMGIEVVRSHVARGRTAALMGSSGVGKTTLINGLLGVDTLKTGEVRTSDGKGRHVTSRRELLMLPGGGLVIDTPGMREVQLWAEENSLTGSFGEIEDLASRCRFNDCSHREEPGCAVLEALEAGTLSEARLKAYRKLQREIRFLATRRARREDKNAKARWKRITKGMRQRRRLEGY
jgi:ribosome biogenesis GTPase